MTIQYRTLQIPFAAGEDDSVHGFALPAPRLQLLVNGRFDKTAAISKRPGWARASDFISTATHGVRCFASGGRVFSTTPLSPNNQGVASSSPLRLGAFDSTLSTQREPALNSSLCELQTIGRDPIMRDAQGTLQQTKPDWGVDSATGHMVIAWTADRNGASRVYAQVIDASTRQVLVPTREISTVVADGTNCSYPRIVRQGTRIFVIYFAASIIRGVEYVPASFGWGTDTAITAADSFDATFDVADGSTVWMLMYRTTANIVRFRTVNALALVGTTTIAVDPTAVGLGVINATSFWYCYFTTAGGAPGVKFGTITTALALVGPFQAEAPVANQAAVQVGIVNLDDTHAVLCWTLKGDTTSGVFAAPLSEFARVSTAGATNGGASRYNIEMISKPLVGSNGTIYCNYLYNGSVDGTAGTPAALPSFGFNVALTMALSDTTSITGTPEARQAFRVAGTWAQGLAGIARRGSLSRFAECTTGEVNFCLATATPTIGNSGFLAGKNSVDICRLSIDASNYQPVYSAEFAGCTVFAGSVPMIWDGSTLTEYGFIYPPECANMGLLAGAGSLGVGSYALSLIWEYRLATGDVVQSAPAVVHRQTTSAAVIVVAAAQSIPFIVPSLTLTRKFLDQSNAVLATMNLGRPALLKLYRTEVDGSVLWFEGEYAAGGYIVNNAVSGASLTNSPGAAVSDATAIGNEQLYTTDGILPNYALPALAHITTHRGRIYGISAEDRHDVVFTHIYEPGEMPGWHPDLVLRMDAKAIALASIDERLIVFTDKGIYLVLGNGPDREGLNSDFATPQLLNAQCVLASPGSIVSVPMGIMFHAIAGMFLLDRKLQVVFVGAPIEDKTGTPTSPVWIPSACVLEDRQWVYWIVWNSQHLGDVDTSYIICYDWGHDGQWSADQISYTNSEGVPSVDVPISLCYAENFAWMTTMAEGIIWKHAAYSDPCATGLYTWIPLYLKTAWMTLGQMQAYQRFRHVGLLGERAGAHDLLVTVAVNYNNSVSQSWTVADTTSILWPSYVTNLHVELQRATALQVEILDADPLTAGATAGPTLVGLALECGFKKDLVRLPAAQLQ